MVVALGGAFAMARGVDLEAGARAVGAVARARAGAGAVDAVGLGGLTTVRGADLSAERSVTGSGGGAAGVSTVEGAESLWTTVPADWATLRQHWEIAHAANVVLTFAALCLLVGAALATRK